MKLKITFLIAFMTIAVGFSQSEKYIEMDGSTLCYTEFGQGEPILIINGGPGMSSEGFIPLAKSLSENNRTIIYDQRGTGKSKMDAVNSETISMDLMIQDIETLRKHLNINNWIVFGHSFGGMLASYYTSKYPEAVKGLILSSSGGIDLSLLSDLDITSDLTVKQRDSLRFWDNKIRDGDDSYYASLQRGKYLASAYLYDKSYINVVAERLTQGNSQINNLVWEDMRQINFDCKEGLEKYKGPVLIIQGKQDIINKKISVKTNAILQNSMLVYIDKCAHYGWLEQPEVYFKEVKAFLKFAAS